MHDEPSKAELKLLEEFRRRLDHKWALRVLTALSSGPLRFSELRNKLTEMASGNLISDSVLANTLHDLESYRLVTNTRDESSKPIIVSTYAMTEDAREILPELQRLARRFLESPADHTITPPNQPPDWT